MCSHHLVEPVACAPASGWEKGQVENEVGNLRDNLFLPKPRVSSLTELNAWLEDECVAYATRMEHPEFKGRTVWEVFQDERASLVVADYNRYNVDARAAGRMVQVRSHADRIVMLLDDEVVADHVRDFRRG